MSKNENNSGKSLYEQQENKLSQQSDPIYTLLNSGPAGVFWILLLLPYFSLPDLSIVYNLTSYKMHLSDIVIIKWIHLEIQ